MSFRVRQEDGTAIISFSDGSQFLIDREGRCENIQGKKSTESSMKGVLAELSQGESSDEDSVTPRTD